MFGMKTREVTDHLIIVPRKIRTGWVYGYQSSLTSEMIIPAAFEEADPFSEELAAMRVKDKWGYIDKDGKFIIEPQFSFALRFMEGKALVRKGESLHYINKDGEKVSDPPYSPVKEPSKN